MGVCVMAHDEIELAAMALVTAAELEVGMMLSDNSAEVTDVHTDDDGLWIEWSDGDCGYMSPSTRVRVWV
jgi:hypothetical protein